MSFNILKKSLVIALVPQKFMIKLSSHQCYYMLTSVICYFVWSKVKTRFIFEWQDFFKTRIYAFAFI